MNNPSWVALADDRLCAFPASSFLSLSEEALEQLSLAPYTADEPLALGLCGRMAKDGHSFAISLPRPGLSFFAKLVMYLHRMRVDTLEGYVLGAHMQPQMVWERNDVVWLGRPNLLFDALDKIKGIQPVRIGRKGIKAHELLGSSKIARTPLLSYSLNNAETFDLLHEKTRPFVFVIDATSVGIRDGLKELWEGLSIYFPKVPVLIFSSLGDLQTDEVLQRLPVNRWIHRLHDQHEWLHRKPSVPKPQFPWKYSIATVPDAALSGLLSDIYSEVNNLRNLVSGEGRAIQQSTYYRAAKVLQVFATLCCPLETRERLLGRHSRRGLFPIRTIERELEILDKAAVRYGDVESCKRKVHELLCRVYQLLVAGTTGKTQALEELVKDGIRQKQSTLILVADKPEEEAVIDFLHSKDLGLVDNKQLAVVPAGHIKSAVAVTKTFNRCLVFTRIWNKDMWWLAGVGEHVYWLCYPFEAEWVHKRLGYWERKFSYPSAEIRGKADLLRSIRLKDAIKDTETLDHQSCIQSTQVKTCKGDYPRDKEISISRDSDCMKWLTEILDAEERIEEETTVLGTDSTSDCARITLQQSLVDILWPVRRAIHVLSDDSAGMGVERKTVAELAPGDQIILMQSGEVHGEILQSLFNAFDSSAGAGELNRWATHWETLVDSAMEKYGTAQKLLAALESLGTKVTLQTIHNWEQKKVMGPEDQLSIKNMALAADNLTLARYAPQIHQAIKRIWTEHRQIGKDLHQALLGRAGGATKIRIGSMEIDTDTLDEILEIHTVHYVELPGAEPVFPKSLADLVAKIQDELGDKLLLTRRAISSMEDSPYRDLDKAWACFNLIASDLWRFFMNECRRGDVMSAFQQIGVELKSGTSQITQGLSSDYKVRYEGETVDIGAHLCLGTARDPAKTMRIHYHWAKEKKLVVIHHAGKHLSTRYD